jgi:hypothetical protein
LTILYLVNHKPSMFYFSNKIHSLISNHLILHFLHPKSLMLDNLFRHLFLFLLKAFLVLNIKKVNHPHSDLIPKPTLFFSKNIILLKHPPNNGQILSLHFIHPTKINYLLYSLILLFFNSLLLELFSLPYFLFFFLEIFIYV